MDHGSDEGWGGDDGDRERWHRGRDAWQRAVTALAVALLACCALGLVGTGVAAVMVVRSLEGMPALETSGNGPSSPRP
jgi:hypothetical protein